MSQIQMSNVASWLDAFRELKDYAAAQRGKRTIDFGDACTISWPNTSGRDVLAIAAVFDGPVRAHVPRSLLERWITETDLVTSEPVETQADTYVGNRSFWLTLVAVAVELTRVAAPMPAPEAWDAAVRELATPRLAPRNGVSSTLVTVLTESTWESMVARQRQFFGALRGEESMDRFSPAVPRTTNADAIALALYWTEQLARVGGDSRDTEQRLTYAHWRQVASDVVRYARPAHPRAVYLGNDELWHALSLLADSDVASAAPAPWAVTIPIGSHGPLHRNAAAEDRGPQLEFPAAASWDDAARMQRDALAKLRGEDLVDGLIRHIPRTTVSDVRQVAAYWRRALDKAGTHNAADGSYKTVLARWQAAVADVDRIPADANPGDVYAHNAEFWTAVLTIAIQIAVTTEAPSRWTLFKGAVENSVQSLPKTITTAVDAIVDAGKSIVTGPVGKSLLYIGGGLAGAALLYGLLRRDHGPRIPLL